MWRFTSALVEKEPCTRAESSEESRKEGGGEGGRRVERDTPEDSFVPERVALKTARRRYSETHTRVLHIALDVKTCMGVRVRGVILKWRRVRARLADVRRQRLAENGFETPQRYRVFCICGILRKSPQIYPVPPEHATRTPEVHTLEDP